MPKKRPWRKYPAVDHVVVEWAGPPAVETFDIGDNPQLGQAPELIDKRILFSRHRCTLAHELEHLDRGEVACQDAAVEKYVRLAVARKLIKWDDLVDAVSAGVSETELADDLAVTDEVLADRIRFLHRSEKMLLVMAGRRTSGSNAAQRPGSR
ncbi:ImmA/IrrE family metallo-endopeptidase [Spelaeicoccus albus]|uniref:Uncharacterized protein (DUF433 family) n=1 Tax=Spelaeicoccus albus TaxID=1280376 RepID=A0A7Z0D3T3_9MICO|nr:ImmA/IrrE family metallo-endopeptidase [Spelaeicoccus albus]NYI68281.1 uncharacterized protein (DUF433 family) [Spelaeicoccus albus]